MTDLICKDCKRTLKECGQLITDPRTNITLCPLCKYNPLPSKSFMLKAIDFLIAGICIIFFICVGIVLLIGTWQFVHILASELGR